MTKPSATKNKSCKHHTPAFRDEALKLAQRIGVAAAAREPVSTDPSLIPGVASSSRACRLPNVSRNARPKMPFLSGNWPNGMKNRLFSKMPRQNSGMVCRVLLMSLRRTMSKPLQPAC